ncbi:MAG: Hsp70 family protein [Rhodoferax sp.]|nr:Hsp70 family protein [Rhodoferax sp.]
MPHCCAIDFGTSNSAIALPDDAGGVTLVELEPGHSSMPTAVFYAVEDLSPFQEPERCFGRAAIAAYVEGTEGRLMRSMKSILGSNLAEQATDIGGGHAVRYLDVIGTYLRHLKQMAERQAGQKLDQVVLGRPVFFVDDDPVRDKAAQSALEQAARQVGFHDVRFQFEPIAAALDYEATVQREQRVLVADIGGGTSDFSLVRVGPLRRQASDRRSDILANHGVHVAGTDFDRQVELAHVLPAFGYKGLGPQGREVPSKVYFDLATWHLINTVYGANRVAELRAMKSFYADLRQYERLMVVVQQRLGHMLAGRAEEAKIAVAESRSTRIALEQVERGLDIEVSEAGVIACVEDDMARIAEASLQTVAMAGLEPAQVDAVYFTGGSTGLAPLAQRIAGQFASAQVVRGHRFASVAQGLGHHAHRQFATA